MRRPGLIRLRRVGVVALLVGTLGAVLTAANTVPASRIGSSAQAITANALKPSTCSGITLSSIVTGSGTFSGTSAANLVLGSAGVDSISAAGGDDCVLGGGGNDALNGGAGTNVCIGGPGTDTFTNCATQIQ